MIVAGPPGFLAVGFRPTWPANNPQMRWVLVILVLASTCFAQAPATQPAATDSAVDWLLDHAAPATTTPTATTAPATRPASPFAEAAPADDHAVVVTFSDGTTLTGRATTTEGKPIRIWDESAEQYRDVPLRLIRSIEAEVLWERDQPEWKFVASGSDVKETTGRTYPARELVHTVTLVNDQEIRGSVVAPLYLGSDTGRRTLVLHKRQKGEVDQSLARLIYIRRVELGDDDGP